MACLLHFPQWSRQIKNSGTPPTTFSIPLAYIWDLRHFLIFSSRTHLSARWWIIKTLSLFRKERGVKKEEEKKRKIYWSFLFIPSYPATFIFVFISRDNQHLSSWELPFLHLLIWNPGQSNSPHQQCSIMKSGSSYRNFTGVRSSLGNKYDS